MQKRFILIFGLIALLFLVISVYISFAEFPDVPDIGPAHCVEAPGMPCSGDSKQTSDYNQQSTDNEEITPIDKETTYTEKVGVANAGETEISKIDIGQIQTSGIETGTNKYDGTIYEINYDELKKYKDNLRNILACPLPKIIDGDAKCSGFGLSQKQGCYLSCFNEMIYADDDYETCISNAGSSAGGVAFAELSDKQMKFEESCPIFPSGDEYNSCRQACSPDNYNQYQICLDTCALKYHKQLCDYIKCGVQAHAATKAYFQKWLEQVSEEVLEEKENKEVDVISEPVSVQEQKDEEQNIQNVFETSLEDSVALIESVSGKHNEDVKSMKNYYERPQATFPGMTQNEEGAKKKFEETWQLRFDMAGANYDYQDALKKGASKKELAKLKDNFNEKAKDLKKKMQNVLADDSGNVAALWELGILYKFEGNNKQSYEYFRDALSSEKGRNPISYQRRLDSLNNPAIRMALLQDLAPKEKLITFPTIETSPLLKWLKKNLKTFVQPIKEEMRETAENIEKISKGLSLSKYIPKKLQELEETNVEEK